MKDIRHLCKKPPEGIRVSYNEENISTISAEIDGPGGLLSYASAFAMTRPFLEGTPFEGGLFRVKLVLGPDFPQSPPKGFFTTKIFHPNVSETGEICVNTLKKDWKPTHGLEHVLLVVRCLLIVPNPESALNPEAGKLLLENYDDYAKRAQLMTRIHAKPKKLDATAKKKNMDDELDVPVSSSLIERESKSSGSTSLSSPSKKAKSAASSSSSSSSSAKPMSKPPVKAALKRL